VIRRRLVVLKKNPNYHGPRAQPVDAIAIEMNTSTASAIAQVQNGQRDAAMLDCCNPMSGPTSTIATEWGPRSGNAAAGDQRWFGGARLGVDYIALNPQREPFSDPDVRRAVSLALNRAELTSIFGRAPTSDLLVPSVPGSALQDEPVLRPDLEAANALMKGRKLNITMLGWPTEEDCRPCRAFELAVKGQLKKIDITVTVRHEDVHPWGAWEPGSDIDLVAWNSWTDVPDPASLIRNVQEDGWLGEANLRELKRLQGLRGQARIDGAVAFAQRVVDEEFLIVPFGNVEFPFFISERIGCGFVQPAIGAVDLLSCIEDGATTATSSASP
jgi:ABC-type transport system substrate-binding protein